MSGQTPHAAGAHLDKVFYRLSSSTRPHNVDLIKASVKAFVTSFLAKLLPPNTRLHNYGSKFGVLSGGHAIDLCADRATGPAFNDQCIGISHFGSFLGFQPDRFSAQDQHIAFTWHHQ